MRDYKALNLAMSKRKGECSECHRAACICQRKTAAVDPVIRSTGEESAANGNDVQTELLRNPYEGPLGNPAQASDFENGYQNAQSLGHLQIAQAQQPQIQAWAKDSPAWRAGFSQAARTMGCGNVAVQINPQGKVATMTISLPSFPAFINTKIASALGTLAGGLMGAGVGGLAGATGGELLHNEVNQSLDTDPRGREAALNELSNDPNQSPLIDPATNPVANKYLEPVAEHALTAIHNGTAAIAHTPRDSFVTGAGELGAGLGGLAGYGLTRDKKQAAFEAAFSL